MPSTPWVSGVGVQENIHKPDTSPSSLAISVEKNAWIFKTNQKLWNYRIWCFPFFMGLAFSTKITQLIVFEILGELSIQKSILWTDFIYLFCHITSHTWIKHMHLTDFIYLFKVFASHKFIYLQLCVSGGREWYNIPEHQLPMILKHLEH